MTHNKKFEENKIDVLCKKITMDLYPYLYKHGTSMDKSQNLRENSDIYDIDILSNIKSIEVQGTFLNYDRIFMRKLKWANSKNNVLIHYNFSDINSIKIYKMDDMSNMKKCKFSYTKNKTKILIPKENFNFGKFTYMMRYQNGKIKENEYFDISENGKKVNGNETSETEIQMDIHENIQYFEKYQLINDGENINEYILKSPTKNGYFWNTIIQNDNISDYLIDAIEN